MITNPKKDISDNKSQGDIHTKVELICEQGCTVVRKYIEVLEVKKQYLEMKDSDLYQTSDLLPDLLGETTLAQRQEILDELKTIMSVYDDKGCSDS